MSAKTPNTNSQPSAADSARSGPVSRPPVTALVTCFNEEQNIGACLDSLAWCDEILVVDSYSKDRTPEIARAHPKVRFVQHEYHGGAAQKNWSIPRAQHEWVLLFDSDERCTPQLRAEIETLMSAGPTADAYVIRRRCYFMGKVIRFSGWRNDRVVRLFKRDRARYQNRRVHSRVVLGQEQQPAMYSAPTLAHPMDHHMVDSVAEYMERTRRYSWWGAAQAWRDGKRASLGRVVLRSSYRFFRTYIIQGGFLDGAHGLVFCMLQACGAYMKWATVWGWQRNQERGMAPDLPYFDEDAALWESLEAIDDQSAKKELKPAQPPVPRPSIAMAEGQPISARRLS